MLSGMLQHVVIDNNDVTDYIDHMKLNQETILTKRNIPCVSL